MTRIEMTQTFPVSVHKAFGYITDLENWKAYWPGYVRINNATARWRQPGDTVVLVVRLMGREVELDMVLTDVQPNTLVRYRSSQRGLPDALHERYWRAMSDGCEYQIIVSYEPRRGLIGIFDRLIVQRSVRKAVRQTLKNLNGIFEREKLEQEMSV
jgi:uncharacterized protein YndB with AHSA1/START domain